MKSIKETVENHPIIFFLTTLIIGATSGITLIIAVFNYNSNYIKASEVKRDYINLNDYNVLNSQYQIIKDSCNFRFSKGTGNIKNLNSENTSIINEPKGAIEINQ